MWKKKKISVERGPFKSFALLTGSWAGNSPAIFPMHSARVKNEMVQIGKKIEWPSQSSELHEVGEFMATNSVYRPTTSFRDAVVLTNNLIGQKD